jgi:hypothetical protein
LQADDVRLADAGPMQNAIEGEYKAIKAMVETAPTTQAGLQALADHLHGDRQRNVGMSIERIHILSDGRKITSDGGDGVAG